MRSEDVVTQAAGAGTYGEYDVVLQKVPSEGS